MNQTGQVAESVIEELQIIDAHTHTEFTGGVERTSGIPKTKSQYFKEWREAGVVGAVAHTSQTLGNFYNLKDRNVTNSL